MLIYYLSVKKTAGICKISVLRCACQDISIHILQHSLQESQPLKGHICGGNLALNGEIAAVDEL